MSYRRTPRPSSLFRLTVFLKPFNSEIPQYISDAIERVSTYCLIPVNSQLILNLVRQTGIHNSSVSVLLPIAVFIDDNR